MIDEFSILARARCAIEYSYLLHDPVSQSVCACHDRYLPDSGRPTRELPKTAVDPKGGRARRHGLAGCTRLCDASDGLQQVSREIEAMSPPLAKVHQDG